LIESAVRANGDLAGVFEYDGETCYFYLVEAQDRGAGARVLDALLVLSGEPDFARNDVAVRWDGPQRAVGLFIRGRLWAVIADSRAAHGGRYRPGSSPRVPEDVVREFAAGE